MPLAPPIGGAARRLLLLPRAHGRHEDDMIDARLHGRVDGSDVMRPALSGFRIYGRYNDQTIETRIGLRKAFGLEEILLHHFPNVAPSTVRNGASRIKRHSDSGRWP